MSDAKKSENVANDCAFSAEYDHEKKCGKIEVKDKPNALVAAVSLAAMACVTVIASFALRFAGSVVSSKK